VPQLDTPTLLLVLALSNALIAAVIWMGFRGVSRAGWGKWIGALIAQSLCWIVLLTRDSSVDSVPLVIAGTLLVYGFALQVGAVLDFHKRRVPKGLLYGLPIAAMSMFVAGVDVEAVPALSGTGASGAWLLAIYGLTTTCSFAFLLMHKARTRALATTDPLTGVHNRRMFSELAESELSRARRADTPASVLAFDLDRFKLVNDMHGHLAGDKVLVAFAALVRRCLRAEDLLARHGGEEFIALLPDTTEAEAITLAERIRRKLADTTLRVVGKNVRITVSIGVTAGHGACLPSLETLLARADTALYCAKAQGRNRVLTARLPPLAIAA
jgi:diguanylate cyclase (GGDEF)-like protein